MKAIKLDKSAWLVILGTVASIGSLALQQLSTNIAQKQMMNEIEMKSTEAAKNAVAELCATIPNETIPEESIPE